MSIRQGSEWMIHVPKVVHEPAPGYIQDRHFGRGHGWFPGISASPGSCSSDRLEAELQRGPAGSFDGWSSDFARIATALGTTNELIESSLVGFGGCVFLRVSWVSLWVSLYPPEENPKLLWSNGKQHDLGYAAIQMTLSPVSQRHAWVQLARKRFGCADMNSLLSKVSLIDI